MHKQIIALTSACVAAVGSATFLGAAGLVTNLALTGSASPVLAKSFKEANGWSSGDYFGPRSLSSTEASSDIAASCRERNGWGGGDYFGPKC